MRRWEVLFVIMVGSGCGSGVKPPSPAPPSEISKTPTGEGMDRRLPETNWRLLDVGPKRKVTKIVLRVGYHKGALHTREDEKQDHFVESTDENILRKVTEGLTNCLVEPSMMEGVLAAGSLPEAELTIETTTDKFRVFIQDGRFALNGFASSENVFYSWILAHVCDDLRFSHTLTRWEPALVEQLSGEQFMRRQKAAYEK